MKRSQHGIDASERRQLVLLGAAMASKEVREQLEPANFPDADVGNCIEEMQGHDAGTVETKSLRHVATLMSTLRVTSQGGKLLDALRDAVHLDGRAENLKRLAQLAQTQHLDSPEAIEKLKKEIANV